MQLYLCECFDCVSDRAVLDPEWNEAKGGFFI